ncbi:MAG: 3-dehydroquinate synthase [Crocinitomicaceae bacterium]|jgi:3-dehydroquinate synthase
MYTIQAGSYQLELGSILESSFADMLEKYKRSTKILIADENTSEACLAYLITNYDALSKAEVVVLPIGEDNKTLEIVGNVWDILSEYGVTRHDVIINVGGGLVTDMGGFIASCYKRGIDFINIPTSLLGMVDASIGGKTGVNLGDFKNQVGVFNDPAAVYIDTIFLSTLPEEEMLSGYAEMLKHGLITSPELFERVVDQMEEPEELSADLLRDCIEVKNAVVVEDPLEKGPRKVLNFGHTIGHTIEGFLMFSDQMTHGYAIAIGMIFEAFLSMKRNFLKQEDFDKIESAILRHYPMPSFSNDDIQAMTSLLSNDKKNNEGKILSCLLEGIGKCTYDHEISVQQVTEVFLHYKNQQINLN